MATLSIRPEGKPGRFRKIGEILEYDYTFGIERKEELSGEPIELEPQRESYISITFNDKFPPGLIEGELKKLIEKDEIYEFRFNGMPLCCFRAYGFIESVISEVERKVKLQLRIFGVCCYAKRKGVFNR